MPSDRNETMTRDDDETLDRRIAAAFAKAPESGQLVPLPSVSISDAVITAQRVEVERDEAKVLRRIRIMAAEVGDDWFYRYPVKNRNGTVDYIEGPSIKCANNVARMYGNCQVDTRVVDNGDSWIVYARFVDYETGFSYTRPFQQRKGQQSINSKDSGRQLDIALQIGVSKSIRNVICNALETFTNFAFDEAKNAIVMRVGQNLDRYRDRVLLRLGELGVPLQRVEAALGRVAKDWLAADVARVIAQIQAIGDGMATIDETWPATADGAPPRPTREQFADQPAKAHDPFTVVDGFGNVVEYPEIGNAEAAYRLALDEAEAQRGETGLATVFDNNGLLFTQLEERGFADLSRTLSLEYGRRRQAAAAKAAPQDTTKDPPKDQTAAAADQNHSIPRGTMGPPPAERPGPGRATATLAPGQPDQGAVASVAGAAGDLFAPRDPAFWRRPDGKRLLPGDPEALLRELPQRLGECRMWAEVDDIERHNGTVIRGLAADERTAVAGLLAARREQLRSRT